MNAAATAPHDALLPQSPGGNGRGAALALLVHIGLIAALTVSVRWRSPPAEIVAAELWSTVPQAAAPPAMTPPLPPPAPEPPPRPAPEPAPPKPTPPSPTEAQIAIEKAKKAAAEQERAEREKQARLKVEREKAERERVERERLAREKAERERVERERLAREKAEREKAEEKRLAQQREENLRRMMGQIAGAASGAGAPTARGTAAVDAAPSQAYAARLRAAIFPNIVFTEAYAGNPEAEVEVRAAPNGTIIARRIVKPSGNREWDEAVLKAIDRTGALPRDVDGRVPATLTITFRPTKS